MQHHINTLVKHFFQKENLQQVTLSELEQFTEEFPFAAAGQLLYARKLKEAGQNGYDEQAEKATLYFHNPIWSNWLIQDKKEHIGSGPVAIVPTKEPVPVLVFDREADTESVIPVPEITEDTDFTPPPPPQEETELPVEQEQSTESNTEQTTNNDLTGTDRTEEIENNEAGNIPAELAIHSPAEQDGVDNWNTELPEQQEQPAEQPQQEETPVNQSPETEPVAQQEVKVEEPVATAMKVAVTPSDDDDDIPFDSYHTIDYFASQGIKLKPEDLPKDKLGQQLKSFTDWLRSMKRIAPAGDNDTLDEITNQAIQQIAEHSVAGKEIITEAMAEVWAKQGHREKAVAIYEKLSLLNPAKTTYFAARIEQLKAV